MGSFSLTCSFDLSNLFFQRALAIHQLVHNILVQFSVKQFPEDDFLIIRFCTKKLHKFSLSDHSNLHKLAFGKTEDLPQLTVCFLLWIFGTIWHDQADRPRYFTTSCIFPRPSGQKLQMSWNTADSIQQAILSCPFGKNKFYKWFNVQLYILTLQYNTLFLICTGAGFTVKSKYNGIKYSCFSCSGISGHKKQILIRLLKIDLCQFSIGAKRLYGKFHRSHFVTSCTVLIIS